jgi:predicted AlkP superfamily phosphohydrolase/phosphomutase
VRRARFVLVLLAALVIDGAAAVEVLSRAAGPAPWRAARDADSVPRVVVLGFDGVDPKIVEEYLPHLPAIRALRDAGGVHLLQSEIPPESPVAWAAMLTGVNPGRTGITDFVSRDPETYTPGNGMVDVKPPRFLGGVLPVRPVRVTAKLDYPTFLERVAAAGYRVLALRQPLLFPSPDLGGAEMLAGLGTPDVAGSNGLYALYDSGVWLGAEYTPFDGHHVRLEGGPGAKAFDTFLDGPFDPTSVDVDGGRHRVSVPLRFERESDGRVSIEVGGRRETVPVGGQTTWMRVPFAIPSIPRITVWGRARFLVRRADDRLVVLSDPVQIDPLDPALPISTPRGYAADLERRYGPYKTTGWMEQTFQLNDESTTEERFLADLLSDMDHGRAVLLGEMARGARCVFYVFTQTDRAAHCFFWRRDRRHPAYDPQKAAALEDPLLSVYERMDAIVGDVAKRLRAGDLLLVVSDHGFQSWRRGMNVNQWLMDEGYLVASDAPVRTLDDFFARRLAISVDWSKTRAYALGLGQVYLNRRGREGKGIVSDEEAGPLVDELERRLLAYKDPLDGTTAPIRKIYRLHELYTGPHVKGGAEIQLAFGEGYRISWQTALLGGMKKGGPVMEDNAYAWSGDHCSTDRDLVPGVLLSNRPLPPASADRPYQVRDVAATVLRHFGLRHDDLEAAPLPIEGEPPPPAPAR